MWSGFWSRKASLSMPSSPEQTLPDGRVSESATRAAASVRSRPEIRDFAWLREASSSAVLWATPSVLRRITKELDIPAVSSLSELPAFVDSLIVAGGGSLMDQAKHFRARLRPD